MPEVCTAIWEELNAKWIHCPSSEEEWLQKAREFEEKWDYPFGLGALDGKHCQVQCFGNSGSLFYNFKSHFSVVLLALVDANNRLLYVDIGGAGGSNDAGILQASTFQDALQSGALNLPKQRHNIGVDYHFIGDDAFGHTTRLVKPFPLRGLSAKERVFNYRFSRARRIVESTFGLMASRFRVLRSSSMLSYDNVIKTIQAVCVLPNFCLGDTSMPIQEDTRSFGGDLQPQRGNRSGNQEARDQRRQMADYFFHDGIVE